MIADSIHIKLGSPQVVERLKRINQLTDEKLSDLFNWEIETRKEREERKKPNTTMRFDFTTTWSWGVHFTVGLPVQLMPYIVDNVIKSFNFVQVLL